MPADQSPARRPPDPKKLCGMPFTVGHDEQAGEDDLVYCGLHVAHSGPHIALLWWFDPPEGDTDA